MARKFAGWSAALAVCWGMSLDAAEPMSATAFIRRADEGAAYSAVALRAAEASTATRFRCAIIVDTSASQVGAYRTLSLKLADAFAHRLPADALVRVYAADQKAVALSDDFCETANPALKDSFAKLSKRVPLGPADLHGALGAVLADLSAASVGDALPACIVVLGDGQQTASADGSADFAGLTATLLERHVPVHVCGIGSQIHWQNLGMLAHQTGGYVLADDELGRGADDAAATLARAAAAWPVYPKSFETTPALASLALSRPLPLRADRETILLARESIAPQLKISAELNDGRIDWTINSVNEVDGAAFLPAYWDRATRGEGSGNALAGLALFSAANREFQRGLHQLVAEGRSAVERKESAKLQSVVEAIRQREPNAAAAANWIRQTSTPVKTISMKAQADPDDGDQTLKSRTGASAAQEGLIEQRQNIIRVQTERLKQEVSTAIQSGRRSTEPALAIDDLKQTLGTVRSSVDVDAKDRAQLEKLLENELFALSNKKEILDRERIRVQQRISQSEAQKRLVEQSQLEEERLTNLIDRVRALMEEGRHGNDEAYEQAESVARVAVDIAPGNGTTTAAVFTAEAAQQLARQFRLRERRADMFLETLHAVELTNIPVPDEPPIRYPAPEVWRRLTEMRRKLQSVDLQKYSRNEQRILEELRKPTKFDFTDSPLRDAIEFIEDLHRIEIWIDYKALEGDGIAIDTPVNLTLSGISLKSGLKLMLEGLGLAYIIEDEVMKITTQTAAEENFSTRVYYAGDLVVQLPPAGGGGAGGQQGGLGGQQGGGGFGGQQGGGGFGGQGGGGFFSVPPKQPQAVAPVKKN